MKKRVVFTRKTVNRGGEMKRTIGGTKRKEEEGGRREGKKRRREKVEKRGKKGQEKRK